MEEDYDEFGNLIGETEVDSYANPAEDEDEILDEGRGDVEEELEQSVGISLIECRCRYCLWVYPEALVLLYQL